MVDRIERRHDGGDRRMAARRTDTSDRRGSDRAHRLPRRLRGERRQYQDRRTVG